MELLKILILIIVLILFGLLCKCCQENFENNNLKFKSKEFIIKDLNSYNQSLFDPKKLEDYYNGFKEPHCLVKIDNNNNYKLETIIGHIYSDGEVFYDTFTLPQGKSSTKLVSQDNNKHKTRLYILNDIMKELKNRYKLPQCTFIINFTDFKFKKSILPIFENSSENNEKSIMFPYWYFIKSKDITLLKTKPPNLNWKNKIKKAFWRGSTTGESQNNYRTNNKISRKYVVDLSQKIPNILDAKFVNFPQHGGKILKDKYKKHEKVTISDQLNYKYIVSMDGNSGTYGLYWQFLSNSLILNNSTFRQWFTPFFKNKKHYLEFNDIENNSDLDKVIMYAMENDDMCEKIANNCRILAKQIFNDDFVFNYIYNILLEYNKVQKKFFIKN